MGIAGSAIVLKQGSRQCQDYVLLHVLPKPRLKLDQEIDDFIIAMDNLPAQGVSANEDGDVCESKASYSHVVLKLEVMMFRKF